MFTDPEAQAEWRALGLDIVPVIALGERRQALWHVDQLRDFLGLPPAVDAPPYQSLVAALDRVLEAVERAVRQVPTAHLATPTPNRGRDLRELIFNIHDPVRAMGEALGSGRFERVSTEDEPRSRHFATTELLADYARATRLGWLARATAVDDEQAARAVPTPRGPLTHQQLLEAQAHHAAQHLRQIYVFLREIGIAHEQELTVAELAPITLGDQVF